MEEEKQARAAVQIAFLATQEDPSNADAWLALGAAYLTAGNARQAIQAYTSCVRKAKSPTSSPVVAPTPLALWAMWCALLR